MILLLPSSQNTKKPSARNVSRVEQPYRAGLYKIFGAWIGTASTSKTKTGEHYLTFWLKLTYIMTQRQMAEDLLFISTSVRQL